MNLFLCQVDGSSITDIIKTASDLESLYIDVECMVYQEERDNCVTSGDVTGVY